MRVINTAATSQIEKPLETILRAHELEKKRIYNQRISDVEYGTLTPFVFTTSGCIGAECLTFHKVLAEKLAMKIGERYKDVIRYVRIRISFIVITSALLCVCVCVEKPSKTWQRCIRC